MRGRKPDRESGFAMPGTPMKSGHVSSRAAACLRSTQGTYYQVAQQIRKFRNRNVAFRNTGHETRRTPDLSQIPQATYYQVSYQLAPGAGKTAKKPAWLPGGTPSLTTLEPMPQDRVASTNVGATNSPTTQASRQAP